MDLDERKQDMSESKPNSYYGHRNRLRDRFVKLGIDGFSDYEVVELLLTLAIPRSDVKQPAKALITRFGNLRGILDAPLEELRAISGIGTVTPVALQIIKAACTLYLQQCGAGRDTLAVPTRLAPFRRTRLGALPNPHFAVAYLHPDHPLLQHAL